MNNFNLVCIPEEIKSEFSVEQDGKTYASRRATARMCGLKDCGSIRNLLNNLVRKKLLSPFLQPFAGEDFTDSEVRNFLPDTLVAAIIQHYAHKGREQAQKTLMAFAAIGIRTWIQQELGWQAAKSTIENEKIKQLEADNQQLDEELGMLTKVAVTCFLEEEQRLEEQNLSQQEIETVCGHLAESQEEIDFLSARYKKLLQDHNNLLQQRKYRQKLNQLVAKFGGSNDGYRKAIWNKLYGELIAQTGFEVYAAAKLWNCSCLDAVEIQGAMERLYYIASEFAVC